MNVRRSVLLIAGALLALAIRPAAQNASDRPHFSTLTAAVQVDVVVRDKKGATVKGLTAQDFDLFENGVKQKLLSCEAVGQSGPEMASPGARPLPLSVSTTSATPPPAAQPESPTAGQTVVALVFDWLSEQPRQAAWTAARTVLNDMQPGDYVGVFVIDHSLQQLVPFTRNTRALSAGFELALKHPRPASSRASGALANALVARPEASPTAGADDPGSPASAGSVSPGGQDAGSGNADAAFAAMLASIDAGDRYINKEMQANAGADSLRGLVRALAPLAGRKTVILFSEGLSITNGSILRWRNLQNEANRHNVAFYTFDAVGLRVQSQQAEMGRRIGPQFGSGFSAGQYDDTSEARLEQLLGGPTHGLAELANSTGGQVHQRHERPRERLRARERRPPLVLHAGVRAEQSNDGWFLSIHQRENASTGYDGPRTSRLRRGTDRRAHGDARLRSASARGAVGASVANGVSLQAASPQHAHARTTRHGVAHRVD